jgi:hypothetical protein
LAWFEVEVHSMVLDLEGSRLIRTERYRVIREAHAALRR